MTQAGSLLLTFIATQQGISQRAVSDNPTVEDRKFLGDLHASTDKTRRLIAQSRRILSGPFELIAKADRLLAMDDLPDQNP